MIDEELKRQSKVVGSAAIQERDDYDNDADDDVTDLRRRRQQQQSQTEHHPHFHIRPAASFHEALLRLIPLQATKIRHKASPQSHSQPKPPPHADAKPRAQRECRCEREQKHRQQQQKGKGFIQSENEESKSEMDGCEEGSGQQKAQEKPWGATYRSCGLYCEVKLAEMLGQAGERALSGPTSSSQDPHAHRTRICIQILSEMCEMNTPFSRVLNFIFEELQRATYSSYVTSQSGLLTFEKVPYFDLVSRLEEKVKEMEEKIENCELLVLQKQSDVDRIKQDMQAKS